MPQQNRDPRVDEFVIGDAAVDDRPFAVGIGAPALQNRQTILSAWELTLYATLQQRTTIPRIQFRHSIRDEHLFDDVDEDHAALRRLCSEVSLEVPATVRVVRKRTGVLRIAGSVGVYLHMPLNDVDCARSVHVKVQCC